MKLKLLFSIALASALLISCSDDNDSNNNPTEQNKPDDQNKPKPEEKWADLDNTYLFDTLSEDVKSVLPVIPAKSLDGIGQFANDIVLNDTHAFVVDSTNNVIHRIALDTLDLEKNFVDLGQNIGPYTAYADNDELYIVCNQTQQVVKVNLETKAQTVVIGADHLVNVAHVLKTGKNLIIADSEYNYDEPDKTEGQLIVITEDGTILKHKTATPNPTFLQSVTVGDKQYIVSSNSGLMSYDANWKPTAPEQSCMQLWNLSELTQNGTPTVLTHCEPNAYIGRLTLSDTALYAGDGTTSKIYTTELSKLADFDTWTSMTVGDTKQLGMTIPVAVAGDLAVFNFNADTLTWIRGDKKLNLKLSNSDASKKGPMAAAWDAANKHLFVVNGNAGSIDVLSVQQ